MENRKTHILLIEDDKVDQMAFRRYVKEKEIPYDLTIAGSISEAKNILDSNKFDAVISDHSLGDGTAFDILEMEIDSPIVLMTGIRDQEVAVRAMKSGAYDYLVKDPENNHLKVLTSTVENAISRRRIEKNLQVAQFSVESASEPVFWISPSGQLLFVNQATCEALGYERKELLSMNWAQIMRDGTSCPIENLVKNLRTEGSIGMELDLRRKDETTFPVDILANSRDFGEKEYIFIFARDITERRQAEMALRESEEIFRRIAETSIDFIFQIDTKGNFIYCSPSVEKILGLRPEEIAGSNLQDFFMPSDFLEAFETFKTILLGRSVGLFEMTLLDKRGAEVQLELSAVPIVKNGQIVGLQGIARDVTEHKRTQRALRESEDLYRTLTQAVVDAIITVRAGAEVTFWNEGAERIFGYPADEAMGKNLTQLIVPEQFREKMDKGFEEFAETGAGPLINNITEAIALRKNGEEFPLELSLAPVRIRGEWQAVWMARDITERKQAEKELKKWTRDLGERMKELNCLYEISRLVEKTNTSKEEMLQGIVNIIPSSWQYPDLACARIVVGDKVYKTEKFKETRWMQASEIKVHDEPIGSVEVYYLEEVEEFDEWTFTKEERNLLDAIAKEIGGVVNRKDMEEELKKYTENLEKEVRERSNELIQSEKMSSLGQLVAGVAHEINNPMAYLKTNTEFLEDDLTDLEKICGDKGQPVFEEMRELIKSNQEGIDRITTITKTLKRFARPDDKGRVVSDINQGLKDTLVIIHNRWMHRINVHEDYGDLPKVVCNIGQLNQVFMNLIMNSSQAMGKGDIWLKTWSDEGSVYVQIRDNGKGIPEEKVTKIFDPFYTTKVEGTGLGLSLSYRIVQAHDGDIKVESDVGKGTTMTIKLPTEGRK
ncbi:MAG: PAS domain S-box protein [Thermoplasmata archaeon]